MIDGSLLSRSIYFSNTPYNAVKIKPEKIHVAPGSPVQFVCHWPITVKSKVIWKHNDTILKPSKLINIGTIQGKSILHILSATSEYSGDYRCILSNSTFSHFESEPSSLVVDEEGKAFEGVEMPPNLSATLDGAMMFECLFPGTQGVRWLLERRSYEKKGETLPRIESKVLGNGTILTLKNITSKFNGNIKCIVEVANNSLITRETEFRVLNETWNYATTVYTPIERKQGTGVSFRCETYDILGETPEMAKWFLNGKPIEKTPNIKITRTTDFNIGRTDLIIAIAEAENEGLYTCIISNEQHERIHQLLLQVDVTTNETIQNLKVTTDHSISCIQLQFDLPPSTELSWAHFTPFFVVVHEANSTKSLNSLPLMAKCNWKLRCKMEICQSSGLLEEATTYVFRISMVMSGSGTVITPLSKPVTATTWDSTATKCLPLAMYHDEIENSLTIKWDIPKDVKGKIETFSVQVLNYSEKMSNLFSNVDREYYERPVNHREYRILNVSDPFAYKVRVTPLTRTLKLPSNMQMVEFFPFILFTSEQTMASIDSELPIPEFSLFQQDYDAAVNVSWNLPDESLNISKIAIKYQHVAATQAKFISIERGINEKSTELTKGVEAGFVYQICASFIRKTDFSQSGWKCQTIAVKNEHNALIYTTLKEAWNKKQLPPAVICERDNCRCVPSSVNNGGIRVQWNAPPPRNNDTESVYEQSTQYTVHYTFNETDPASVEHEFPANDGDLFAEISNLLPDTTYRIMIETQNELNDKVDGTFFSCKTPSTVPLPPPKKFNYQFVNATHVKFSWVPFKQAAKLSGYTIFLQADNEQFLPIFIPGSQTSSHIYTGIRPEPLYHAYIVSRSLKFEESSAKSPVLLIRMPPDLVAAFEEIEEASTRSPAFYRDPDIAKTLIIFAIATATILSLACFTCCLYFWCCVPLWKRRKQARREALERAHSNASSKLSLDSGANPGQALVELESIEILNIPPDPPNFTPLNDTKGGPGGARTSGNRRFREVMHDEGFRQQLTELNRDPTGFGMPACTRDICFQHIQSEEDRKFHELVERERHTLQKRRTKKKRRKGSRFSNIAETSFMETSKLTPNPSLHDDAYSEDGGGSHPASISMTELSRPSEGLSPRSHSIAIYRRFFPRTRPKAILPDVKKALMEPQPQSSTLKPDSHLFQHNNHHNNQRLMMNSPSSLPNLADSGIVFDDLSTSGGTTTSTLNPCLPTIYQSGSCSGSQTFVDSILPKKSHSMLNQHLQDCHKQTNSVLAASNNNFTLVP